MTDVRLEDRAAPVSLRDYVTVLRLHARFIALTTAAAVVLAILFSLVRTPMYTSEATVLVGTSRLSTEQAPLEPNLLTEQEVVGSVAVANRAAERLGLQRPPEQLLQGLTVETVTDSEILTITYTHPDPTVARRLAQAFARSYLDFRQERTLGDLQALRGPMESRLEVLREELEALNAEIARVQDPAAEATFRAEADSLIGQIAVLEAQLTELSTPETLRSGELLSPASTPTAPSSPNLMLNALLGLVLGLGAGVALAFLREHLGDRIRGSGELEVQSGAPVLGIIPRVGAGGSTALTRRRSARVIGEAFRTLRTALLSTTSRRGARNFLITSPHSGEGKTTVTANLGLSLARAGQRVVVVPADLRKSDLVELIGDGSGVAQSPEGNGASEPGLGETSPEGRIRVVPVESLVGGNGELLPTEVLRKKLDGLRDQADIVLIDSPPIIEVADALSVAALADGVLLVAAGNQTPRSSVREARRLLDQVDANVVGAILNRSSNPAKSMYYDR